MLENPYPGVHAHLNSVLQQPNGGWESFHAAHIMSIQRSLTGILPDNFFALPEKSLQISEIGLESRRMRTRPDISIYRTGAETLKPQPVNAASPTRVLPLPQTLMRESDEDEDDYLTAVGIYEVQANNVPGRLVTRIEVLSPSNKPGAAYPQYSLKRLQSLQSGVNLVEIDYLHTTRPIVATIPAYPQQDDEATPYYVLVSDPHPSFDAGNVALFSIAVDAVLPRVPLPLIPGLVVVLDMQATYRDTLQSVPGFRFMVNLDAPPVNLQSYTDADQATLKTIS
jgi:hypothetical protein